MFPMKKIFAFALLLAIVWQTNAQSTDSRGVPPIKTTEHNKDRFIMSMYNCFWQGLPTGVEQRGISQGYNIALMFDIPTSERSLFSFGLGLGYTRNHLYSNAVTKMDLPVSGITVMNPIDNSISYSTNKLSFTYLNIPLELRFRSKMGFRMAVGLRSGLLVGATSTFAGHNPDTLFYGQNGQLKIVNGDISNTEKYLFELTARIGWKFISVNGSYALNKAFVADKGPQINPYTLGVTLSLW
jgi:hypothetical protein